MNGKRYYLTTLDAWQRYAPRCNESHFLALESASVAGVSSVSKMTQQIVVLVTADEAAHIALENDAEVEALPHPLARTPISERAAAALAPLGVNAEDDTFTVAEKLARVNPLLRHRVF
jgi:hypothetical protein